MVSGKDRQKYRKEIISVIATAGGNEKLLAAFLTDLLTPVEFDEIAARWQIVKLLHEGTSHHEIAKRTHTAVATVTRGSREMHNPHGGFRLMLKKFGHAI